MTAEGTRQNGGTDTGLRKKAVVLSSVILLLALVVGSLFGDRGILQWVRQRTQVEDLEREIGAIEEDNRHLAAEILALKTDPRTIERLAREELGMALDSETVILIQSPPSVRRP
jgi:cell division protein FtsB